ncbi:MAG TPA: hypothetical protein VLI44_02755 [Sporolactobacillaceae bacterium]|nr:hypothetical protein [Sporolactobacillaceae bacterium]
MADVGSQIGIVYCDGSGADAVGEFVAQGLDVAVVAENLCQSGAFGGGLCVAQFKLALQGAENVGGDASLEAMIGIERRHQLFFQIRDRCLEKSWRVGHAFWHSQSSKS